MADKIKKARYPSSDEPILSHFKGVYDSVFVALHPFISIDGLDPAKTDHAPFVFNRSEIEGALSLKLLDKLQQEKSEKCCVDRKSFNRLEKQSSKFVTWQEVCAACSIENINDLNRALLTDSKALKSEYADKSGMTERLRAYCAEHLLFMPTIGRFPVSIENKIIELFAGLGFEDAYFADEFDQHCEMLNLSDLSRTEPWSDGDDSKLKFLVHKIFSSNDAILVIVDWDSHFSLICTNLNASKSALIESLFEGFWCDEKTLHT